MFSQRLTLFYGCLLGGLAVALGAFGAHAFKEMLLQNHQSDTYELAVRYHFFHALALILISLVMERVKDKTIRISAVFIFAGIVLFSGSLYVMAIFNTTKVALITPFGGTLLLIGWGLFSYSAWKSTK